MAHVQDYKKKIVSDIVKNIESYPIVGIANMENLPAPQLQRMREKLRGKVLIFMTKKRLIKIAFEKAKEKRPGVEHLTEHLLGMPALVFTKENPFSLFKVLKENKSKAPAKAGQTALIDIIVQAGPTGFAPGPVIGELGSLGVKTMVENGKITIKETTVVCREGKQITDKLAAMLVRLGIEPMEVGLDLSATFENGIIFTRKILDIDEKQFLSDLARAHTSAMGLAIGIVYTSPSTIKQLVSKAHLDSKSLAVECKILTSETVKDLVAQSVLEMRGLAAEAKIAVDETMPRLADHEIQEVEDLARDLLKKGTLR